MYRTTAATGGSHPQHILLLETHIFPAKCQLGEEIKVSRGLAAAPVGSEFHLNSLSFRSSSTSPADPPGDEPLGAASSQPSLAGLGSITSCPFLQSTWMYMACPQGCPPDHDGPHRCSSMMEFPSAAHRATAHMEIPGRDRQGSVRDQPCTPGIQPRHPGPHSNSLLPPLELSQSLQGCSHHTRNPQGTQHPRWPCQNLTFHATSQYRNTSGFVKKYVSGCDASETFLTQ